MARLRAHPADRPALHELLRDDRSEVRDQRGRWRLCIRRSDVAQVQRPAAIDGRVGHHGGAAWPGVAPSLYTAIVNLAAIAVIRLSLSAS